MAAGRIHSFETFGAADGPGVRFIVFLSGCGFRCLYCHNPDTWAKPPAFEMSAEDVLAKALRYRSYWRDAGGITASGGEPMLQSEFVAELFELAHKAGATTCFDTSACAFPADGDFASVPRGDAIRRMLDATDTVLLDIKHIDDARHRALTGCGNAAPIACARYLAEIGKRVWIRHVLVPGWTDGEDDLRRLGDFIRSLGNVERVDVLPYHVLGVHKWRDLGLPYALEGVDPPTDESVARARKLLSLRPTH
ncbi:MAG: pyruvate formate lyase-activating protein [Lentisphaerae bacterium]|jgi:pyruvate formate lyase activating enzyme|nr:pyruvate formate lyase-activating protein [Lentisphaerota bacterium]